MSKTWSSSNSLYSTESAILDNWKYLPSKRKVYLPNENMLKNVSFSIKATSTFKAKICSFGSGTCNDVSIDTGFYSTETWQYFSIRTDDKLLYLRNILGDYEIACAYDPKHQELPNPGLLRKPFPEHGITVSNLNLSHVADDNIFIQSLQVPRGFIRLYECNLKIFIILILL